MWLPAFTAYSIIFHTTLRRHNIYIESENCIPCETLAEGALLPATLFKFPMDFDTTGFFLG